MEAETGGERWRVEERDAGETRAEGLRLLGKGDDGAGAGMLILGNLYGAGVGTVGGDRVGADNKALGVEMRGVGDLVREVLET